MGTRLHVTWPAEQARSRNARGLAATVSHAATQPFSGAESRRGQASSYKPGKCVSRYLLEIIKPGQQAGLQNVYAQGRSQNGQSR